MEPVSARFEKFEPVHRVSGKIFFETGLQTGLSEPGHSPNYHLILSMNYLILRTGHFDHSFVGHVIFFTSISEKALKNKF